MSAFLQSARDELTSQKRLADRAVLQVSDEQLHWKSDDDANSIAIMMQHPAGNMKSRWTDFLTTDGEKTWRQRDAEFIDAMIGRAELTETWEAGWATLFTALEQLTDDDLPKTVTIRGEALTVLQAIQKQLAHYAYHVGQITYLARQLVGVDWQTLSVARTKPNK